MRGLLLLMRKNNASDAEHGSAQIHSVGPTHSVEFLQVAIIRGCAYHS
jgi:hypothetical protein